MAETARFVVVGSEPDFRKTFTSRQLIVGPWLRQPEHYPGYNGFVGWAGVCRLRSGRWLLTFSSGYWHASPPMTAETFENPEAAKQFAQWSKIGMPKIDAPRGGRSHIMSSEDEGKTWSEPQTLIDTDLDDRHPTIIELDDGTLLCTFFQYAFDHQGRSAWIRSTDGGQTWSEPQYLGVEARGLNNGAAILADGAIVWAVEYGINDSPDERIGIYRSTDNARSFQLASIVKAEHGLHEPSVAKLADGRLIMMTRPKGEVCWSEDGGQSWSPLTPTTMDLYDPHLLVLPNGVLACVCGSYVKPTLRIALSCDGGQTWRGPGEGYGFCIDSTIYGYSHPILLPDHSIYVLYQHTGGHRPHDARTEALWGLRLAVHDSADGIDILPAPGSPDAMGAGEAYLKLFIGREFSGGDPRLGALF